MDELLRYMRAMVALQVAVLAEREDSPKPEILLHRAGLDIGDIAQLVGKKYAAVAKAISRERAARKTGV